MPPPIHPDTILDKAEALYKSEPRVIRIEATILTYFADYFNACPQKSARKAPSSIASVQSPS